MKRLFGLIAVWLITSQNLGYCTVAQRYKDLVFTQFKIDSILYRTVDGQALMMDVYQPLGDTTALRPLVILAHGGSFMANNRRSEREERVPALCRELSMRGYVAVSIDYRLANLLQMAAKNSAYVEIIKSVADGRASVSWFLNDIAKANTYRVDKDRIFFGGNSAGAILAEQLVFIESAGKCGPVLCKTVSKFLEDTNALPPHTLHGIISLAGAVLDTNIIGATYPALLHIQGDADRIVPYGYKKAIYGLASFKMAGLGGSRPRYISQHLNFTEYVFKHGGHTPWDRDDEAYKVMLHQVVDFLWKQIE